MQSPPPCAAGFTYNTVTRRCEVNTVCPSNQYWNGIRCFEFSKCTPCEADFTFNEAKGRCEKPDISCPRGQYWNGIQCVGEREIPTLSAAGFTYNAATVHCEKSVPASPCPLNQYWNGIQCVGDPKAPPPCAVGFTYNAAAGRCETTEEVCKAGQYLDGAKCTPV